MFKHYINAELQEETPSAEDPPAATGTPPLETPPVETPPEPPVETPPDDGQDVIPEEEDLWGDLATDTEESEDLETEEPVTPPAEEEPTPTPPVEPAVEPVVEPPAPAEAPVTPPVTPPEIVPVETPPAIEPEPTPPSDDEVKAANQLRYDDTVKALTERFSITEEEALQLVTEPAKVFPQLQARMFADMWEHMTAYVRQNLPAAIDQHTQVREVQLEKVNMFFERFPKLNRKEHGVTVAKVSGVFNQLNPNATEEEILNHVGIQTMMLHGIAPDMIPAKPNGELPVVTETPVTPHVPAAVNTGRPAPIQQSDNIWSEMSEDLDED